MKEKSISETHSRKLVFFAAERTLLSWVRTALSLMVLGFILDRFGLFLRQVQPVAGSVVFPRILSLWSGATMIMLGSLIAVVASVRYLKFYRLFGEDHLADSREGILVAVGLSFLIAAIGIVLTGFLLSALV